MIEARPLFKFSLLLCISIAITACSSSGDDDDNGDSKPVLEEINQLSLGDLTTRLSLATANKEGTGFLVTTSPDVIGVLAINGENSNVILDLDTPITDGDTVTVTLYDDTDGSGDFNMASDLAVQSMAGGNIEIIDTISVPASTPDVRLRMTANGNTSWSIDAEPDTYNDWGSVGNGNNPSILIPSAGVRFEVVNPAVQSHPFSLIDSTSGNLELITQTRNIAAGTGTFFSDIDVNVVENGNTIQFTVTAALLLEVNKYRCDVHTNDMLGTFVSP